ncbi:hypothetical protein V2J09_011531 [Rumex salicifolius]
MAAIFDTAHEIAVYIHRFHNLDLFEQGWYQIKITMRLEDNDHAFVATPSRVVQYEGTKIPSNTGDKNSHGGWRIDDTDNSFSTQPFKIKYARQDVLLSIMISFNLSMGKYVLPSRSAVILKFELMYEPVLDKGSEFLGFLDTSVAAYHEFRIPPKALSGLHSYCPVCFDSFHAVLVDISVHITLLKSLHNKFGKVLASHDNKDADATQCDSTEGVSEITSVEDVMLVKELLTARDILLEEMDMIRKSIDHSIDLTDIISQMDDTKLFGSTWTLNSAPSNSGSLMQDLGGAKSNIELLHSLPKETLTHSAEAIGSQILYLWKTFLTIHRENTVQVLEYLCETWANDRRAEWSIWMVYSKVEISHDHNNIRGDEASCYCGSANLFSIPWQSADPSQTAITRAELHRRSISQMRINSRSIQDMQIYGDLSNVPVVIVERVMNAPIGSNSDQKVSMSLLSESNVECKVSSPLKIVVFVHGFQGHHLDLRLVRNQWILIDPKALCLMSEINEDKTSGDFIEMGSRLAKEVTSFIKRKMKKLSRSGSLRSVKLSFVGHSIGNIIIRTALADKSMEPYLDFLHTYVSLSGPHLGYMYSPNSLLNSGLWLLKKLKNTQCIHQLTLTDDPDLSNTFFYKLCQKSTLSKFKNVLLLSSPQDGYVPYHSARIEHCQASLSDFSKRGKVFLEMLNNCLEQINSPSIELMRCDVNFNISSQGRSLNTFIGRAAHIEFLETDIFAKFIMWSFQELFR